MKKSAKKSAKRKAPKWSPRTKAAYNKEKRALIAKYNKLRG